MSIFSCREIKCYEASKFGLSEPVIKANRHWSRVFSSAINQKSVFGEKNFWNFQKKNLNLILETLSAIKTCPKETCSFIFRRKTRFKLFIKNSLKKLRNWKIESNYSISSTNWTSNFKHLKKVLIIMIGKSGGCFLNGYGDCNFGKLIS